MTLSAEARGHLIGGDQVPAASRETFESLDPSTAKPLATLALGGPDDVDRAVAAAQSALPGWRALDPYERGVILQRLADLIDEHGDELTEVEALDAGKLRGEAARDIDRAVRTWTYYAGWPTKITGTTNPADPGVFSYSVREPVGVVGAITPWNFPLVIASWKLAPALACGNTVVHKPAEEAPLSALRVARARARGGSSARRLERRDRRGRGRRCARRARRRRQDLLHRLHGSRPRDPARRGREPQAPVARARR